MADLGGLRAVRALAEMVERLKSLPRPLALIPTMGALHDGHLSLIKTARDQGAKSIIVSIFVNPSQFAAGEDFATYPRTEAEDVKLLAMAGVDLVWLPDVETIYPSGFSTLISLPNLSQVFEGVIRPNHFSGVATVVARLLRLVKPDLAIFGQKDYQQLLVIVHLVRDLELGVEIIAAPIFRNSSGLALSSRNRYLSPVGLNQAANLSRVLDSTADALREGGEITPCLAAAHQRLLTNGFEGIDYFDLVVDGTVEKVKARSLTGLEQPTRLLAAARLQGVRLLDNWRV